METLLKIGGVLAVLVVPIILSFLNNRLAHLKHTQESKAEALKLADEFEAKELEKRSTLYKDRLAKSLFNNDVLTYSEAKFFSNYENADLWVREYVKIRGMLKRERDDDGAVTEFKHKSNWIKVTFALIGYVTFAFIGLTPFYKFYKYVDLVINYYEKGMFLSIFIIVALHVICLVAGFLCLKYVEKCADCGIFLHDFYKVAFKVKGTEEKNDSEVDVAA